MQTATALRIAARDLSLQDDWPAGPTIPLIHTSDIHVWRINLNLQITSQHQSILSKYEHQRAEHFRCERERRRFLVARLCLRLILARYLSVNPAQLKFQTNAFGKPFLPEDGSALRFNLSRSNELALLVVAAAREVGIDIEFMRAEASIDELAQRFFSYVEVQQLRSINPQYKTTAFFNCWTRKEAYIKARGQGLFLPPEQFDVSIGPDEPPSLLANRLEPAETSRWSFRELFPAAGYAATVAIEGTLRAAELWSYVLDPGRPAS